MQRSQREVYEAHRC